MIQTQHDAHCAGTGQMNTVNKTGGGGSLSGEMKDI